MWPSTLDSDNRELMFPERQMALHQSMSCKRRLWETMATTVQLIKGTAFINTADRSVGTAVSTISKAESRSSAGTGTTSEAVLALGPGKCRIYPTCCAGNSFKRNARWTLIIPIMNRGSHQRTFKTNGRFCKI